MVETLAIAPQAYLPKFGEQFNLFSCVYTQAGSLTIAKWSKFGVYTYPLIILRPGKLLLPALQSEMDWMLTLSQPRQGNQRVLSPGRWLSYFDIAIVRPGCPCRRHVRESLCKNTPRPWGGGVFNHFYLHSIYLGLGLLPSISSRYGWVLGTSLSPFFCFLFLCFCLPYPFAFSLVRPFYQPYITQ